MFQAGAKEAYLIETAAAAAIGVGLPIYDPIGSMIIDIGGGTTNIAILSLGGIVISKSIHLGSRDFDEAIKEYIRHQYAVVTDDYTVEEMKIHNGSAICRWKIGGITSPAVHRRWPAAGSCCEIK